jgi:[acyl-carrier-protein] S-malonyltransferase
MGAELFEVRPDLLGEPADRILGWSLREICLEAPEETLTRTEHAQPAIFAVSYALWDELQRHLPHLPAAAAGHSLGEYTALAAAGAIAYEEALGLVAERGRAMAAAADLEPSGMAALIGVEEEEAARIVAHRQRDGGRLYLANLNAPGQVVVGGSPEDLAWLEQASSNLGVRRVIRLKVAGAFHSPFMAPAADRLARALNQVTFHSPRFPIFSNADASAVVEGTDLAPLLRRQVISPVRFSESLGAMAGSGISRFIHVGPGDVTAGLARKSVANASTMVVSNLDESLGVGIWLGTIE